MKFILPLLLMISGPALQAADLGSCVPLAPAVPQPSPPNTETKPTVIVHPQAAPIYYYPQPQFYYTLPGNCPNGNCKFK